MMGATSIWHWLIVLLIIALVFGTKKLRNMGSDVGHAIREFKEGMDENSKNKKATLPSDFMYKETSHLNRDNEQSSTTIKSDSADH